MDPDVQIMYLPSKEKHITRHSLKVSLSDSHNRRPLPSALEACIDETWTRRVSDNPTLWNGSKFRISSVSDGNDGVTFHLGITSYKDFIGTNWSPSAQELRQLGSRNHSDTQVSLCLLSAGQDCPRGKLSVLLIMFLCFCPTGMTHCANLGDIWTGIKSILS